MTDPQHMVTVWFSDGHVQRWPLPEGQTREMAMEELRQVIVAGQWFQPPQSAKRYSPYAIVAVEIAPAGSDTGEASTAHRLGEVIGDALSPDDSHD